MASWTLQWSAVFGFGVYSVYGVNYLAQRKKKKQIASKSSHFLDIFHANMYPSLSTDRCTKTGVPEMANYWVGLFSFVGHIQMNGQQIILFQFCLSNDGGKKKNHIFPKSAHLNPSQQSGVKVIFWLIFPKLETRRMNCAELGTLVQRVSIKERCSFNWMESLEVVVCGGALNASSNSVKFSPAFVCLLDCWFIG